MKHSSLYILALLFSISSCNGQENNSQETMEQNNHNHTNKLIESSSPYLLQHAHNPVEWYPWGQEALDKAKKEDKPIIVSIGYSACHWCHVMERESFENEIIAAIMNKHFVCIKVDREERPDVDQVYMDAVHAMGLNGGWPLNVFLTPDQKPFYGGTYFPPEQWTQVLQSIVKAYAENRDKIEQSAEQFANTLSASEIQKYGLQATQDPFEVDKMDDMFENMSKNFDRIHGGSGNAPKFPMPSKWLFLLRYYNSTSNELALKQIKKTLNQMAYGGIYDQVGGGFARYSVDAVWHAPHFEKMLYDNAQLVSLYAEAYALIKDPFYKKIAVETAIWIQNEMTSKDGGFYASLDADSEGVEGKFYVWKFDEYKNVLDKDADIMLDYYNVKAKGNWEHGNNILHKTMSDQKFAEKNNLTTAELDDIVNKSNIKLFEARKTRIRPGLDDKILLGWNAMMSKGLIDSYNAFGDDKYLTLALKNIQFIEDKMRNENRLYRNFKNGKATIDAYLEDYALYIEVLIAAYQTTFNEDYLSSAKTLTNYVIKHFYDNEEGLFFYTNDEGEELIARKKEIFDNVIPASNSIMACNLHFIATITDDKKFHELTDKMLSQVSGIIATKTSYMSNWANLFSYRSQRTPEIVIIGKKAAAFRAELMTHYIPNKVVLGSSATSDLPLLKDKYAIDNKTTIYVCFNKTCKFPVFSVKEALKQIKSN